MYGWEFQGLPHRCGEDGCLPQPGCINISLLSIVLDRNPKVRLLDQSDSVVPILSSPEAAPFHFLTYRTPESACFISLSTLAALCLGVHVF